MGAVRSSAGALATAFALMATAPAAAPLSDLARWAKPTPNEGFSYRLQRRP